MMNALTLDKLNINESGSVAEILSTGAMRRRMIDLGIVEGTHVECIGRSPSGDPSAYLVRGAVIAIRAFDASSIVLSNTEVDYGTH